MTALEAAALAVLGRQDRRLVAALLRIITNRFTVEDQEALPSRERDEPLLRWACRCRASSQDPSGWQAELARIEHEAVMQLSQASHLGACPVPLLDRAYPQLLGAIHDPPPLLWVRGDVAALSLPAIAIVGSRAATPYGLAMARQLSTDLVAAGVVVVSGLARGVDAAAHVAAVAARGRTVGVLGSGIDRIYPPEHRDLAREMEGAGAVVSEFPAGVPPLPHHFPLRNRIISGLSTAIVVVEAPEKSGALITASAAADQGRDVLVVPGPATGGRNRGGHLLIRDGAKVVESAADILQELGSQGSVAPTPRSVAGLWPETTDFTVDDVAALTGETAQLVLARLLDFELSGRIQRIGGGRFIRVLT
ncbi:MAG: DNA-protecting protein DprA [Acidobacteria bacterium]|nr:DNA-protecting protein DprA [Acidobacteriota bacterium]